MKKIHSVISLILALILCCSLVLTACSPAAPGSSADPTPSTSPSQPIDEYKEPLVDGYNQVTFYWNYPGSYENCDIWIWWGDVAGKGYTFHECAYGGKVVVNVPDGIQEVGLSSGKIAPIPVVPLGAAQPKTMSRIVSPW